MRLHVLQRQRKPQPPPAETPSHAPAPSNRDPAPAQRTSRTAPSFAAQVKRPSQTAAHTAVREHTREGHAPMAATPRHAVLSASAYIRARAYAPALPIHRVRVYTALPTGACARAQKPRRMAAISTIAGKGIHVPAYAGCISRLLAPKVARPSRRPWSALQLHAPQAVAFRTPLASPRRRKARPNLPQILGGMVCLTPWFRQPANGLPPHRSKSASGSCSAGARGSHRARCPTSVSPVCNRF